jgi:hypothetical protein
MLAGARDAPAFITPHPASGDRSCQRPGPASPSSPPMPPRATVIAAPPQTSSPSPSVIGVATCAHRQHQTRSQPMLASARASRAARTTHHPAFGRPVLSPPSRARLICSRHDRSPRPRTLCMNEILVGRRRSIFAVLGARRRLRRSTRSPSTAPTSTARGSRSPSAVRLESPIDCRGIHDDLRGHHPRCNPSPSTPSALLTDACRRARRFGFHHAPPSFGRPVLSTCRASVTDIATIRRHGHYRRRHLRHGLSASQPLCSAPPTPSAVPTVAC